MKKGPVRKHKRGNIWYFKVVRRCTSCGRFTEERILHYGVKPASELERYKVIEYVCANCE